EPAIAPDAVLRVHHWIAHLQLRQVLDQRLDVADLLLLLAAARARRGGEELGLSDEVDAGFEPREADVQLRDRDADLLVARLELLERIECGRRDMPRAQEVEQA